MSTAAKLERKIASLENFKEIVNKFIVRLGDPSTYEFRGEVIDLGTRGKGRCTCDTPIRYMFLIWDKEGRVAPVGCECIKHFQAYNETLFNKLENARFGLYEALAREERERAEALRLSKLAEVQPRYELARRRFLAVCKMHKEHICFMIPRSMWLLQSDIMKTKDFKKTHSYIKHYETMLDRIEQTLAQYEKGELN